MKEDATPLRTHIIITLEAGKMFRIMEKFHPLNCKLSFYKIFRQTPPPPPPLPLFVFVFNNAICCIVVCSAAFRCAWLPAKHWCCSLIYVQLNYN